MATSNRTFSVKNGVDVANTIIIDGNRNISNVASLNVAGNVSMTSNIQDIPTVAVTTSGTYADNVAGKTLVVTSASDITITFAPASIQDFAVSVIRAGAGNVIIANAATITRSNIASYISTNVASRNSIATVIYTATNAMYLFGDIEATASSGGDPANAYAQANLAYAKANSAANTARVSANGGSTQVAANGINFINTASVTVVVSAGTDGNANVAFSASGTSPADAYNQANNAYAKANSAANTVRVSANSGSTIVAANGINFINTSTVTVTVASGVDGNANISFVSAGGGGTPAGANQQLQFNNNGAFGATANLDFDLNGNIFYVGVNTFEVDCANNAVIDTPIKTTTSSITVADNAAGQLITVNNTTALTITFAAAVQSGFSVTLARWNTGNVTIANTAAVTRRNTAGFSTMNIANRWSTATVIYTATNEILVVGDII